ncbi:AbrB/MazE/SpoVT family DNA-binding domain-containing protein [Desulfitibacter alkalitolerans]|uniref:AbrB/MazE/SpoVT family DNA-binding domain-containing protein n=1 Tax=Desulfitibacter alkalitolerans TaxID=264641 RepID=UPI0006879F68|nr:type II toxin-antitoxin system PrlF family antitoxin [Desulfitibacter alkalitolerans]
MKRRISSVTKKGQVTIPQVVREKLEINYGDKVEFIIDGNNQVKIRPIKTNLENIYGVLKDKNVTELAILKTVFTMLKNLPKGDI